MAFFRRRRFVVCAAMLAVIGLLVAFKAQVLTAAASAWVVNEPPGKAAAIVVLGGGVETRPFAAARLYREGYAPRVLVAHVKRSAVEKLGLKRPETEIAREVLIKEGVPETAIELIGTDVSSTFEEVMAVKEWVKSHGVNQEDAVLIPTNSFCTRRIRWIFGKKLEGAAIPKVVEIPSEDYGPANWWQHESGLIDFQNEVIKHLFYRIKY